MSPLARIRSSTSSLRASAPRALTQSTNPPPSSPPRSYSVRTQSPFLSPCSYFSLISPLPPPFLSSHSFLPQSHPHPPPTAHFLSHQLTVPLPYQAPARRVMSLTHPTNKMSKSDPNPASRVLLTDDPDQIRKKIGRALTDSDVNNVTYDPAARPGVANLLEILSILQGGGGGGNIGPAELARDYQGVQRPLRALKERTADAVVREFGDVRERYRELLEKRDGAWLDEIEAIGAKKARANADVTIRRVKEAVGL